jgi:serine/threonine-protein kinase
MPEFSDPTAIRTPEPPAATAVRPPPGATDETLVRAGTAAPASAAQPVVTSGSAGFAEETRRLLRRRLLVTHAAVGLATGFITLVGLTGIAPLPAEAGLGRWAVGLPLLAFGQSAAGLAFLLRRPDTPLSTFRFVEVSQFAMIALAGGVGRFGVLYADPAASPDPRYHDLLYRFDAVVSNYPLVFAVILYGVLIPNTRRRSLLGVGLLVLVPVSATALAAALNPAVRPALPEVLPGSIVPLFMAGVIAVFSASRANALQRQAFEAVREAKQLGAYTLKKKLGEGGMGEVWLAEHRLLKRPCAMKFIRAELAANPDTARRFEREVRAVTALTHFHTVRVFDYGIADDGSFYYVMEYLDGPTLDGLVKGRGPLAPGRAAYLLRQLCGALAEAHAAGMVHRDLKPGNILVAALGGERDVAKLLDFGLVQDHSATASDDRITRAGTVLGTPSYMCPEQAAGESVDPRGDVYSLGAVAFFMLTGRPPFEGTTVGKLLTAHLTQPAPDVRALRPDVPAELAAVVARCLAKDPKERYQSAAELEAALAACGCSADWNAAAAAKWWAAPPAASGGTTVTELGATVVKT